MNRQAPVWLWPDSVFDGVHLRQGLAVSVLAGKVARLVPVAELAPSARPERLPGILSPGFVDLQVNGGGDVLFNTSPTPEGIAHIRAAHLKLGTAGILPTIITDTPEVTMAAADAAIAAWGQPGILGIHLEGPHLSVARRGTHAERFVRPVDDATIALVARLRGHGMPVMITLAPEAARRGDIARLAATGALVSLGHSDTDSEHIKRALDEGAGCFTHLFNAMSPMLNRAPGVVGAAINSAIHAGIICDGVHVADEMVGLAIRARPAPDLTFLISDAMPTVGGSADRFCLYDMEVRLQNGRLINDEGSLAGAHVTQAAGVHRLIHKVGLAPQAALRMATGIPARLIGLEHMAGLKERPLEEVIVLDAEFAYRGQLSQLLGSRAPAPPC